jgi:DNA adenine methylase
VKRGGDMYIASAPKIITLLKWAGGKSQELKYILPLLPSFQRYYEPFVGGGSVFFSVLSDQKLINDRSSELIHLYRAIASNNQVFFQYVYILSHQWKQVSRFIAEHTNYIVSLYKMFSNDIADEYDIERHLQSFVYTNREYLTSLFPPPFHTYRELFLFEIEKNFIRKIARMKKLEAQKGKLADREIFDNLESALKSAFYTYVRYLYNLSKRKYMQEEIQTALFLFIREYSYASMFRYNRDGDFNAPYGGISYNHKDLAGKIAKFSSPQFQQHFVHTLIENMDFEAFLHKYPPTKEDFLFLDPPYDSEFSTYTQNSFSFEDHQRLATYLLTQCPAKFLLVIKKTQDIMSLYCHAHLNICTIPKRYIVCFQDRNERACEHLIIKNF